MSDNILDKDIPASVNLMPEDTMDAEERTIRFAVKVIAGILLVAILSMTSCGMQSNTYEAEVLAEKTKMKEQDAIVAQSQSQADIEKIKSMERMVQSGVNPIAVRCMIKGWSNDNTCMAVGIAIGRNEEILDSIGE